MSMAQHEQQPGVGWSLSVGKDGWYEPYDFWLSLCGIYDLYDYALSLLGDLDGRSVLECGCGQGHTSVMLAKRGARVTTFDTSSQDLAMARQLAEANDVEIKHVCQPFEKLDFPDQTFDLVFGAFIIHHVDVAKAAGELFRVMRPGARAAFIENSNRNLLLMGARRLLCGNFGIAKYGDDEEEHPLTKKDIATLRANFGGPCTIHYPDFLFFRLADMYVFRKKSSLMSRLLSAADKTAGRIPALRRYSYFQILQLDKN